LIAISLRIKDTNEEIDEEYVGENGPFRVEEFGGVVYRTAFGWFDLG
jgi:hypothetical protein